MFGGAAPPLSCAVGFCLARLKRTSLTNQIQPPHNPQTTTKTKTSKQIKETDGTVRRLGRPTMDGEDEERHTSFRVPPGVKVE